MQDKHDILSIAEQVARQSDEGRRQQEVEAYIQDVCSALRVHLSTQLVYSVDQYRAPDLTNWASMRGKGLAMEMSQVLAILLRRELLPDEVKE